jgi:hypothetical protein
MGLIVLVLNELVANYLTNAAPQQFHYSESFLKKQTILLQCSKIVVFDMNERAKTVLI